ncbi:MAG: hypothetical protein J5526_01325 [Bacteroidales bacterium]|nr:hypothetical protein [Bacteroidales bacterium]
MMKKKALFIVNPISGVGKQKRIEKLLKDNLNHDLIEHEIRYTEYIHHGTEIAREASQKDYDAIVAVGGDGSVNDVVSGMFGSGKVLGIIPCGSGNGLARNMKLSLIPAFAVRNLNYWHEMSIDTILLNEQYKIASIAGVGFDAFIARLMKAAKTRGFPAYLNLILREYPTYECKDYKLIFDGKELERNAWFITFANSNQFGYNATIAPQAKLNDGLIDVSIVDKIPIEHVAITGPLVYANHFELSQHVEMFKAREIVVKGNVDHWVNIDGEGINVGTELQFVNHHASLRVIGQHTVVDAHEYNIAQIKKTIKL